jgi:hypothetical protein
LIAKFQRNVSRTITGVECTSNIDGAFVPAFEIRLGMTNLNAREIREIQPVVPVRITPETASRFSAWQTSKQAVFDGDEFVKSEVVPAVSAFGEDDSRIVGV